MDEVDQKNLLRQALILGNQLSSALKKANKYVSSPTDSAAFTAWATDKRLIALALEAHVKFLEDYRNATDKN